jgi:hypothetical protein
VRYVPSIAVKHSGTRLEKAAEARFGRHAQPKSQNADSQEPGLYPALLSDFSVISFIHGVADNIVDPKVRDAIKKGAEDAASVLKERGGADVLSVSFEGQQHRRSA